tara:strand:- start:684 stop:968 length:285 start_codon:yes stop_codon:yes gene_type:complete
LINQQIFILKFKLLVEPSFKRRFKKTCGDPLWKTKYQKNSGDKNWTLIREWIDFSVPKNSSFSQEVLELVNYTWSYFDDSKNLSVVNRIDIFIE